MDLAASWETAFKVAIRVLANHHLAEDVASETIVLVMSRSDQLREPRAYHAWLRRIATNAALNLRRKNQYRYRRGLGLRSLPERLCASALDETIRTEEISLAAERVREVLPVLTETERELVKWYYLEERSCREISQLLDIPFETVKTRIFRVRRKLCKILSVSV